MADHKALSGKRKRLVNRAWLIQDGSMRQIAGILLLFLIPLAPARPAVGQATPHSTETGETAPPPQVRPEPRRAAPQSTRAKGGRAEVATPGPDGLALTLRNLLWMPALRRFLALADLSRAGADAPPYGRKLERGAALYLSRLTAQGRAAGLAGVLYDNRDRGHSPLSLEKFPQITPVRYGPDLLKHNLDYGLAETILFPAITIGNSSTAYTAGPRARSLPRHAMTKPDGPFRAYQTYAANHIYIYPEHRDHDAADRFPANWPYMLISQGSSGSDRPFLEAVALILASFTPQTRARLEAEHLVAPTVQMVFRRAQTAVRSDDAYLSGAAHPTAFDKSAINPTRMMALANSLTPGTIPPQVVLSVESEDFAPRAGLLARSERLFTTPAAIARIWRGPEWEKEMVISAGRTRDPDGRPLTFRWVLLRGDPGRVRITPLDKRGSRARITLDWQEERRILPGEARTSSRVDIGVFAHNGAYWSAPAFVSVSFPTHQKRRYEPAPGGGMRLAAVDYDARARKIPFDPLLHFSAPWQDRFHYGPDGTLLSLERLRPGRPALRLTAQGQPANGRHLSYEVSKRGALKMEIAE